MDDWETVDPLFLPVPFSSFEGGRLMLKAVYRPGEGRGDGLAVMATDLQGVYFEGLNRRQLVRRVGDALSSSGVQGGAEVGIGEDGERLLQESIEKLLGAISDGTAKAELLNEAFEHFITVSVPGFTIRFMTTSLEQRSASVLAAHLLNPLLGVTSSLLAVLRDVVGDDDALHKRIASAVDSSGQAERYKEGNSVKRWTEIGGAGLVTRWVQRTLNTREQDLQPVSLALPTQQRLFSPSPTKRKPSAPPADASPPPRKIAPASPPPSSRPLPSLAQQMLQHRGGDKGERMDWDSQPQPSAEARKSSASGSGGGKGKERAMDVEKEDEPAQEANRSVDEEEPPTDEEDESAPPASFPHFPPQRSPTLQPRSQSREPSHSQYSLPPPSASDPFRRSPSLVPPGSSQLPPTPLEGTQPEADEDDAEEKARLKKEAKKRAKEKEAADEVARRKERLAKLAGARAQAGGPKKKAVKKL
ncbi:hypothetical protein JCM10213_004306 [Rhodosporidiobolus nylandii]